MRHSRLATTLVAIPLAVAACGTATPSTAPGSPSSSNTGGQSRVSAESYAASLLTHVEVPAGATASVHAPSKALDRLPVSPGLSGTPTVSTKFWTVDQSASSVLGWLRQHAPALDSDGSGSTGSSGGSPAVMSHFLAFRAQQPPTGIAVGDLFLVVAATGPSSSAIGAYALALAQPPRPAAEVVPLDVTKAVVAWSLAPGGTPAEKVLTGTAAVRLAREFNALKVDTLGDVPCPMIPTRYGDVTVTFTAEGHTWKADIPACPSIRVTRDGKTLPSLAFGTTFLSDVKAYSGQLPHAGPPSAPGGATPLSTMPGGH